MTKKGSIEHEEALKQLIQEYEAIDYKIIDLGGKSPDAIGVIIKNGAPILVALDVVSADTKRIQAKQNYFCKQKQQLYEGLGFDQVIIHQYYKPNSEKKEKKEFIDSIVKFESRSRF